MLRTCRLCGLEASWPREEARSRLAVAPLSRRALLLTGHALTAPSAGPCWRRPEPSCLLAPARPRERPPTYGGQSLLARAAPPASRRCRRLSRVSPRWQPVSDRRSGWCLSRARFDNSFDDGSARIAARGLTVGRVSNGRRPVSHWYARPPHSELLALHAASPSSSLPVKSRIFAA